MAPETIANLLRFYSENRFGNQEVVKTLVNSLESLSFSKEDHDANVLYESAIALDLSGGKK